MGSTIEKVEYAYEEARQLMETRSQDYNDSWEEEGLESAIFSLYKKANQLKTMLENGRLFENKSRSREDILDAQNYSVFSLVLYDRRMKEVK